MPEPLQGPRIIIRLSKIKKQRLSIQTGGLPLYPSVYPRSKTYLGPKASKYEISLGDLPRSLPWDPDTRSETVKLQFFWDFFWLFCC